jgi:hypothetical protein
MSNPSIFVSVAAYQDPYLWWTIDSAWKNATHPERLHFAVVDQVVESQRESTRAMPWASHVRYVHLHPRFARGPCWARSLAYSLWAGEKYLLQIDSHMWFQKGWDVQLVQEHVAASLQAGHPRQIITTYPGAFTFQDGQPVDAGSPKDVLVLRPKPEANLLPASPVMMFQAVPTVSKVRIPGYHLGAGCLFAEGTLLQDVPYDPWLYFHGEEQNLAVRAWTRGWDIWHPTSMPILHLYKEGGGKEIVHWSPDEDAMRDFRWGDLEARAAQRMVHLLYSQTLKGAYGLGNVRTLDEFAKASGIDYNKKVVDHAYQIPIPLQPAPINFAPSNAAPFAPQGQVSVTLKRS